MAAAAQQQTTFDAGEVVKGFGLKHEPRDFGKDEAVTEAKALRAGWAATSYKWHWKCFKDGKGYDPYDPEKTHKKQIEFHDLCRKVEAGELRFAAFIGGVGSGKSASGCAEAIRWLMDHPGITGIVAANSYKQLTQSTLPTFLEFLDPLAIHSFNKGEMKMVLTNGSTVYFRTGSREDLLRGIDAGFVFLDEGAFATGKAWRILVGRLRQVGFPQGAWVTTTPNGFNWLYEHFAADDRPEGYEWVQASAWDNPHLSEAFVRSLEATYPGQFAKQEVHGEFVTMEGVVYDEFALATHGTNFTVKLERDEDGNRSVLLEDEKFGLKFRPHDVLYFIDWGFSNPAAILLCVLDSDGRMFILDEFYTPRVIPEDMGEHILEEWVPIFGKGRVVCDPAEPEDINKLARMGLHAFGGNNRILPGIQEVARRLEVREETGQPRLFVDERCENLIRELRMYRYKENKDGKNYSETPEDKDNHACDALRYGAMELKESTGLQRLRNSYLDVII